MINLWHKWDQNLDTLFWFQANQPLHFLISAARLAEKEQIPLYKDLVCVINAASGRTHIHIAAASGLSQGLKMIMMFHQWLHCLIIYSHSKRQQWISCSHSWYHKLITWSHTGCHKLFNFYRPAEHHWQTLSHNAVSNTPSPNGMVIGTDYIGSY
jgi:hypothetical protein